MTPDREICSRRQPYVECIICDAGHSHLPGACSQVNCRRKACVSAPEIPESTESGRYEALRKAQGAEIKRLRWTRDSLMEYFGIFGQFRINREKGG
jgi:hypothetical protein